MEEEFGTLQIRVYTSRAQLPIEDATVVVTQISPTGKYHLLSVQITDREGRVQPLTIPAPPRWESTGPTQDMVPFSVCQVWAEHPGYTALRVDGVQIFSGEETDQDMELIPLAEWQHSLVDSSILNTSPQNL